MIFGLDFHDRPHFFANFSTVDQSLISIAHCNFCCCVIPVHITPEPDDAFILSSQKQFPSFSHTDLHCARMILLNQRVRFFAGIYHLLTAVVLTKRDILHIFPIRS